MSVTYNQGTNYTLYYNALDYFKTIMTNHPSIAKVTTGDLLEVDTKEFPMYPIGNVNIFTTNIQESTTKFQIQLIVADKIKNKNNESNPVTNAQSIPFFGVDDTVDILANTLAIINDLTSYTEYSVAAFDIDTDIVCEPFVDRFNNGLAGHVATFTLTTHNDRNRCLFFLINPSGSGYQIQNCSTSESYYAVLNSQVATGSTFSSTYPYAGTCYQVLQEVEEFDSWNFVNLPVVNTFDNCEDCTFCLTGDIVRDGLIMAYDWTSFNQDGTLTDRSSNGITANWYGNLITSSNALQFDGTSSFITFPTASVNPLTNQWNWTIDTYSDLVYVDNQATIPSGTLGPGWLMNVIAANYGNDLPIGATSSTDVPVWSWGIYSSSVSQSSDNNFMLRVNGQLVTDNAYNVTASLATFNQYSYLGKEINTASIFGGTGSFTTQSFNSDYVVNQQGDGLQNIFYRSFTSNGETTTYNTNGQLVFGGPFASRTYGGSIQATFRWNPISGSVQYILYYNRPLSEAELEQNNKFYLCNNPITPGTTTTTSTTSTTTTSTTSTTTTTAAPACPYTVGELTEGGIVAYTSPSGAIVIALDNIGTGIIGCEGLVWVGADIVSASNQISADTIGQGWYNTANILNACTASTAATLVSNYTGSGYTDWCLGNREEWRGIYANKAVLNANGANLTTGSYWQSVPAGPFPGFENTRALAILIDNGTESLQLRNSERILRPIRYLCDLTPPTTTTTTTTAP